MKKLFISLFLLGACGLAHAQVSSYDYIKAMCDKITQMNKDMTKRFGDTLAVKRIETGVLSQGTEGLQASTTRTLYGGITYLIYVFTDRRVRDLKLNIYSLADNDWRLVQRVNKNESTNTAADNMYGDYEIYAMKPDSTLRYKVEIAAPAGNASAARYGMIIWSKELNEDDKPAVKDTKDPPKPKGGAGGTYFSTSTKSTCWWDKDQHTFNRCQDEETATLFVLNTNKTMFRHTTETMSSSYFVQNTEYDSQNKLTKYTVVSDAGNRYTFMVSDDNGRLTIFCDKGDDSYIVKYTIRRNWTE